MLELVAGASQAIGDAAYRGLPDYAEFDANLPLMGGVNLEVTKDLDVFGGFNFFGYTGGEMGRATATRNWRGGMQGGAAWFVQAEGMTREERVKNVEGVDLNVSGGPVTAVVPMTGGGPPAVMVGGPMSYGVSFAHAKHLFNIREVAGKVLR